MLSRRPPCCFVLRSASSRAVHNGPIAPRHTSSVLTLTAAAGAVGVCGIAYYFFRPDTPRGAPTNASEQLSLSHFTPTTILSSVQTSPTTRLLTLQLPVAARPAPAPNAIWSVYVKDSDIMVERPFTPLYGVDSEGMMELWVKRYDSGEVGRWLHARQPGEIIEVRGPTETLRWPWPIDARWDEVVLISGGTGFAPVFQLLHHQLISNPATTPTPRFTLMHSSRTPSELPPAPVLNMLRTYAERHPEQLRLSFFVDQMDDVTATQSEGVPVAVRRIGKQAVMRAVGHAELSWWSRLIRRGVEHPQKKVLFLVCGPEPMISAIAGPYGRNLSQGAVGGILGELGFTSDQVRKL